MSIGDVLFSLNEALRETRLVEWSLAMSEWPLALWLQDHFYGIPALQTLHILAIAVLFGSSVMVSLRVLEVNGTDLPLGSVLARHRPWIQGAIVALVASGALLVVSESVRNLVNIIFWMKMAMLLVAVAASLAYFRALGARASSWDVSPAGHAMLRTGAVILPILWCLVIAGGRWIAYSPQ